MADDISPPNTSVSTGSGMGISEWINEHKGVAIGGTVAAGLVLFFIIRSRSKSAAASANAQQPNTATPSTVYPYSTGVTGSSNFGDYYAGLLNQIQSSDQNLSNGLTSLQSSLTSAIDGITASQNPGGSTTQPTQPAAPAPVASGQGNQPAGSQPGYGIVPTAQGNMVWLGVWGQPHFNVGGGAPVFFGNASSLAQGPQGELPGNDIYTPVAYASQVSANAS